MTEQEALATYIRKLMEDLNQAFGKAVKDGLTVDVFQWNKEGVPHLTVKITKEL